MSNRVLFLIECDATKQNPKFEKTEVDDSQLVLALHLFDQKRGQFLQTNLKGK